MTPDPKTGLVDILDLGPTEPANSKAEPGAPVSIKMFPVDAREAMRNPKAKMKDNSPRYVLAESYVAPTPA